MAVPRQRPSVRPAGLLVDGVPFETVETIKRPSSCPAGSTTAGASSSSPVRVSSARQADLGQKEHTPGVEASSVHYRDSKYVVFKPIEHLSSVLLIPSSDRLPRPSIDCEAALGLRNERTAGFPASDEQPQSFGHSSAPAQVSSVQLSLSSDHRADLGWKTHPLGLQEASVHHAYREHVVDEPVELQCSSQSSQSNDCRADRGQDDCPSGFQALNVHQADLAHAVFAHVKLPSNPSSDRRPEP